MMETDSDRTERWPIRTRDVPGGVSRSTSGAAARRLLAAAALLAGLGLAACSGAGEGESGDEAETAERTEAPATGTEEGAASAAAEAAADGLVDPNRAPAEELRALSGLPEEAARMIVDRRPFADMVALDAALAEQLSEEDRQRLYRGMWIPLGLNDASDREILLIPGVGDRMLGEFKEYRPYRSMEQFRREIGKYVDDQELDRLERYVRLGG